MDIDLAQYATIDNLKILGGAVAALILVGVIGSFFLKKIRDENDNFLKVFYRNLFNPVKYLVIVTVLFTAIKQVEAGWVENQALCLDSDARDALLDAVIRHRVNHLIISGCDGTPLPMEFRQSIASSNCNLSGLGWLDIETTETQRQSALSDLFMTSKD